MAPSSPCIPARRILTLFAGGEVDICGPAKFTVLLSGDAITLALNFGRVRVNLPANTDLRIFTPTIMGTPLGISGGPRDVSVGLSLDDSLCVLATSGAIQLEHQFTGEKLIVPQAGEFFLNAGRLLPVAGTPGSCQCNAAAASSGPRRRVPHHAGLRTSTVMPRTAPEPAPASAPVRSRSRFPSPKTSRISKLVCWRKRTKRIRLCPKRKIPRPPRRPLQFRCTRPSCRR